MVGSSSKGTGRPSFTKSDLEPRVLRVAEPGQAIPSDPMLGHDNREVIAHRGHRIQVSGAQRAELHPSLGYPATFWYVLLQSPPQQGSLFTLCYFVGHDQQAVVRKDFATWIQWLGLTPVFSPGDRSHRLSLQETRVLKI